MAEGLIAVGKVVLAVAIGLPLAIYFLQERLIFYPQPLTAERRAQVAQFPDVKEIVLKSEDGTRLHAWHVKGKAGGPLVLYFGGNAEEVSWMIEGARTRTPAAGWLLASYRGYGGSDGSPSEATIFADALQWYDYAVKEIKPANAIVFGRSLGSGAAVHVAAERPVAGVILATPYDSLTEVARYHYPWLPVGLLLKHRFDSIGRAPRIQAPLLSLGAGRDEIIPLERAKALFDAWGGPKHWVALEDAGHNTTDSHPLFWYHIERFLQERTQ